MDKKDYLIQALVRQRDTALNALAEAHANIDLLENEKANLLKEHTVHEVKNE